MVRESQESKSGGQEKLLTVAEVADALRVKHVTVRRYLVSGKLVGFQVGREWRVREAAFQRFLEQLEAATQERISRGEAVEEEE